MVFDFLKRQSISTSSSSSSDDEVIVIPKGSKFSTHPHPEIKNRKKEKELRHEVMQQRHQVKPGCQAYKKSNCHRKCHIKIPEDLRKAINKEFWSKTYGDRCKFVQELCVKFEPDEKRLKRTIAYYLRNRDKVKERVCRLFFLGTLGFSRFNCGMIQSAVIDGKTEDNRGKHSKRLRH